MPKLARTRNATAGMTRTAISLERTRQLPSPRNFPGSRSFGGDASIQGSRPLTREAGWRRIILSLSFHIRHQLGEMSTMRGWSRAFCVALVVLAAACTGSEPSQETASVDEVRIGLLAPLSGPDKA